MKLITVVIDEEMLIASLQATTTTNDSELTYESLQWAQLYEKKEAANG